MDKWSVLRKQLKKTTKGEKTKLGIMFILAFLVLASLIGCSDHSKKITATTVPTSVSKLEPVPGMWYKFDGPGVWYKAEQVRYLNIIDSTVKYPADTVKVKLKSGHLEPYSFKVVVVQDTTS